MLSGGMIHPLGEHLALLEHIIGETRLHLTVWCGAQVFYFEERRVFHAGKGLEFSSME